MVYPVCGRDSVDPRYVHTIHTYIHSQVVLPGPPLKDLDPLCFTVQTLCMQGLMS